MYLNAKHREQARNLRNPLRRLSREQAAFLDGLGQRQAPISAVVTMGKSTAMAQSKEQRKKRMEKRESGEYLTRRRVADLLGLSPWTLVLWGRQHCGPKFLRIGRNTIRYPKKEFETWLALLPRS